MYKTFQDPNTGRVKEVKEGYSWTVCFWGLIPMLCRKDWLTAIICFAVTFALNMLLPKICGLHPSVYFYIIFAFYYNKYYADKLIKQGYIQIN